MGSAAGTHRFDQQPLQTALMKDGSRSLTAAAIGAGLALGVALGLPSKLPAASPEKSHTSVHSERHRQTGSPHATRNLASLATRLEHNADLPRGATEAIARSSTEELKAQLVKLAQEPPAPQSTYWRVRWFAATQAAARELFLREGKAAVDWALRTDYPWVRGALYEAAVREDPSFLAGITGYDIFDHWWRGGFGHAAVNGAAMRSVRELLEVEEMGAASNGRIQDLPENFDFETYLSRSKSWNVGPALAILAARDPDAAAEFLANPAKLAGFHAVQYGQALDGYADVVGESEAARWMSRILAALPPDSVEFPLSSLNGPRGPTEFRVRALAEHLPTDGDRVLYVASLIAHRSHEHDRLTTAAFEGLGSPDLQFQALQMWARDSAPRNPQYARTNLENLLSATSLTPAQRDELRAMLPEPVVEEP